MNVMYILNYSVEEMEFDFADDSIKKIICQKTLTKVLKTKYQIHQLIFHN